ncbi:hypothetical protein [Aeoliella mucimassa]|uniref:Uncharacterized protein n=1 Tax=Aeoliella mucimassa TaxID=2527972 RepID=A0A518AJ56_9BACT|nr:hypothetical protein [Aeoliella mucimassa]QDU54767.1 hypothetical protein Pan181_09500 [Aeoliella mucimassa]
MFRLSLLLLACWSSVATLKAAEVPAARVTMVDGRVVTGEIDDATDRDHLWIRRGEGRVLMATSYKWSEVEQVELDGQPRTSQQLLESLQKISKPWPKYPLLEEKDRLRIKQPSADAGRRATSASFVARLSNWDGDVEPDGYLVELTVFDQFGKAMPVRGTVQARLVGERTSSYIVPGEPEELERWSDNLSLDQFTDNVVTLRLPFRSIRPEQQVELAPGAILEIEVGAFGHTRLASSTAVPTRVFNPVRDRFEQRTGSRCAPGERSERWSHE